MSQEVQPPRRRGYTRISPKNQATIPAEALAAAGLKPGDELKVEAPGAGRIELTRADNPFVRYAGSLSGVYPPGYLDALRDESERS